MHFNEVEMYFVYGTVALAGTAPTHSMCYYTNMHPCSTQYMRHAVHVTECDDYVC